MIPIAVGVYLTLLLAWAATILGYPEVILIIAIGVAFAWVSHIPEFPLWLRLIGWGGALGFTALAFIALALISL